MGRSIAQRVGAIGVVGLLLSACGSSKKTTSDDTPLDTSSCEAGARRCAGYNIKVCDDDGVAETIEQTCLPSQVCTQGACVDTAPSCDGSTCADQTCTPNASYCKDGNVRQCDAKGQSSTLVQRCEPDLFCRTDDSGASCSTQACAPDSALCVGSIATTCLPDGSGTKPGGQDCSSSRQACYKGKCRDVACTPGTKLCQHDDVYLCGENGTDLALWADCQASEVCDADQGSCRAKLCEPGKVLCDGNRIVTCNAYGSAWLANSKDCAADNQRCVSGSCKPQTCAASTSYCQDGNVYQCDSTGTSATLSATCTPQYSHCETYNGGTYGYCRNNDCQAGQTLCVDNVIKTCSDDGSLPESGTTCGNDQYCEDAACKDRLCTSGAFLCQTGDIYYCPNSGPPQLSQTCYSGSVCKTSGNNGAVCSPLSCAPASRACLDDQIGTCAADGLTLTSVTEDCATAGSVCTTDLKCAASVTDTIGAAENHEVISAGTLIADAIDVTSSRKLTEIQAQLSLDSARELRWVVYELDDTSFIAKIDNVVSGAIGSGFLSSPALNYELESGKRYLLGVVVSGGDAIGYYDTAPFSDAISFGNVLGRMVSSYSPSFDAGYISNSYVSQMKAITEAP